MTLQDRFRNALDTTADLSLVALGDLSTGLILDWAGREPCPREVLDLLGERASLAFAKVDTAPQGPTGGDALPPVHGLIRFTEAGSEVMVRDPDHPEDGICLSLRPGAALEPALDLARRLAKALAEAP